MYKEKRNIFLAAFLFLQIGLVYLASLNSMFIEHHYSRGLYPPIATALRTMFGWLRVSVGDILYLVLSILILRFVYRLVRPGGKSRFQLALGFLAGVSVFYFAFYSLWGLNYSRLDLADALGLEAETYEIDKIREVTERLMDRSVELHQVLAASDTVAVIIPYDKKEIIDLTAIGYQRLSESFPEFSYRPPSIKTSLFSLPLTYMGFSGYLNPLTGEAQVDGLIPKISFPVTCSHEVAHQLGYAHENEANFIGFLAAASHDDPYFNYAAVLFALRYALSDIYRYDKELFESYRDELPSGILKNLRESDEFWRKYENPFEPFFKLFYDGYLKYNQQEHGLQTYNQIMSLLISFDRSYEFDIY